MLIFLIYPHLFAKDIELKSIKEIFNISEQKIKGNISNLKQANFDKNIFSFEVSSKNHKYIYIYDKKMNKTIKLNSSNDELINISNLIWHPARNWCVFENLNSNEKKEIYFANLNRDSNSGNILINHHKIELKEDDTTNDSYYDPSFDSSGNYLFFVINHDKNNYTIAMLENIESILTSGIFTSITYQKLVKNNKELRQPKLSPSTAKNLLAYLSIDGKKGKGQRTELLYSVNVLDMEKETKGSIKGLAGFTTAPFYWTPSGEDIFYHNSASLYKTSDELIKSRQNINLLHYAKLHHLTNKILLIPQSNKKTNILLKDVTAKREGIIFLNDSTIITGAYRPGNRLHYINLKRWKQGKKNYVQVIDTKTDSDNPILTKNNIYYLNYRYKADNNLEITINSAIINCNNTIAEKRPSINKRLILSSSEKKLMQEITKIMKKTEKITIIELFKKLDIDIKDKNSINTIKNILNKIATVYKQEDKRYFILKDRFEQIKNREEKINELNIKLQNLISNLNSIPDTEEQLEESITAENKTLKKDKKLLKSLNKQKKDRIKKIAELKRNRLKTLHTDVTSLKKKNISTSQKKIIINRIEKKLTAILREALKRKGKATTQELMNELGDYKKNKILLGYFSRALSKIAKSYKDELNVRYFKLKE